MNYWINTTQRRREHADYPHPSAPNSAESSRSRGNPISDVSLAAVRALGRPVGPNEDDGTVGVGPVGEVEHAERGRGLVFQDAIPGMQAGKRARMSGVSFCFQSCPVLTWSVGSGVGS